MNSYLFISILLIDLLKANETEIFSKVLVTTGYGPNGLISEVIDLKNPNLTCNALPDAPIQISKAFGGLLNNNSPMICGGLSPTSGALSSCYILGQDEIVTKLGQQRDYGASAIINRDLLWITGGYIYINGAYVTTDTTEFIRLDQPTIPGPNLPEKFTKHCIAKINEDLLVFTGGVVTATKTLMVDISNNFLMAEGSEMIRGRYDHACGTFDLDGTSVVVVVGGDDGSNQVSTEIWDGTSNGWFEGPDLPRSCSKSSMLTSPDGQGVMLFGCYENPQSFYELRNDVDGFLTWRKMPFELKYPRYDTIAMGIPDEMSTCS